MNNNIQYFSAGTDQAGCNGYHKVGGGHGDSRGCCYANYSRQGPEFTSITFPEVNIFPKINTGELPHFVLLHLPLIVTHWVWIAASALSESKCYIYNQTKPSDAGAAQLSWQTVWISAEYFDPRQRRQWYLTWPWQMVWHMETRTVCRMIEGLESHRFLNIVHNKLTWVGKRPSASSHVVVKVVPRFIHPAVNQLSYQFETYLNFPRRQCPDKLLLSWSYLFHLPGNCLGTGPSHLIFRPYLNFSIFVDMKFPL